MPLQVDWTGVFPAVPTQFHDDFSINLEATRKHIEALLENGVHGLIMLGTIGENCSLSLEEKTEVLKMAVDVAKGRRDSEEVTTSMKIRMLDGGFVQVMGTNLTDNQGGVSTIIVPDVPAANGIIHAINGVLLP